jgi:uncharacterized membrane protein
VYISSSVRLAVLKHIQTNLNTNNKQIKMGRHHDRKYGSTGLAAPVYGRYGMRNRMGGFAGIAALIPLLGLGVVAAIIFSIFRRRRMLRLGGITAGVAAANCGVAVQQQNCATVGFNEKLIAAERLPGVKYREVDVITRKRVSKKYKYSLTAY